MMWPFKWKLSACTYTWCYLFFKILQNEICKRTQNLPLASFGSEKVNGFLLQYYLGVNKKYLLSHHLELRSVRQTAINLFSWNSVPAAFPKAGEFGYVLNVLAILVMIYVFYGIKQWASLASSWNASKLSKGSIVTTYLCLCTHNDQFY